MPDPTNITETAGGFLQMAQEYGLGVFLSVLTFGCAVWMVRFIIVKLTDELEEQRKERKETTISHVKALGDHAGILDKLEDKIQKNGEANREAHQYQRQEHNTMISILKDIKDKD